MTPDEQPLSSSRTPTRPCPFCGLVRDHAAGHCDRCRMPLDNDSVRSLTGLMGPWFVLDERIPTGPGVAWPKFLSLIEKGKVTPETIVRGPATGGLWTPACRAPLVATHLGLCWSCQAPLPPDDALKKCPQCGRELSGPANWPDPRAVPSARDDAGTPAEVDDDAGGAIDELIEAGAAGRDGNGFAPSPRPARSRAGGLILGLVVAALVGGGAMYAAVAIFDAGDPVPPPAPEPQWSAPEPAPPQPGGMFPDVPAGTRIGSSEPPSRRQHRTAQARFDEACRHLQAGDLMAAQDILVSLINTHDPKALPAGAEELLRDTRKRILATRPADGPDDAELNRQRRSAQRLLRRAQRLMKEGNLAGAQKPMLDILNSHHPKAWPEGTLETFRKVKETLQRDPTSQPGFFGIEVGK